MNEKNPLPLNLRLEILSVAIKNKKRGKVPSLAMGLSIPSPETLGTIIMPGYPMLPYRWAAVGSMA